MSSTIDRSMNGTSHGVTKEAQSMLLSRNDERNDTVDVRNHAGYGSISSHEDEKNGSENNTFPLPTSPSSPNEAKNPITYANLLHGNPNFRYFLMSYIINKMGEWLTYLASITMIREISLRDEMNQKTNTLISILILVKLLPNVFLFPIGGVLADTYDRRQIQIILDISSSCVVVIFLWSLATESIPLCLLANFLIQTSSGLYVPSNQAMLPQLFGAGQMSNNEEGEELKKATVLFGMSWSLMAAIGSSLGGVLVAVFGIRGCFIIDSITYLISAAILQFGVQGNYKASSSSPSPPSTGTKSDGTNDPLKIGLASSSSPSVMRENISLLEEQNETTERKFVTNPDLIDLNDSRGSWALFLRGLKFLFIEEPLLGICALLKGSAALSYGAVDVLYVSFSAQGSESDPSKTSLKLGILFGCTGIGCILGSVITDAISNLSFPRRIARLCLSGFCFMFVALFWMGATSDIFASLCLSSIFRCIGSSIVWINSTLLIQKFTPQALLGRVSSFDSGAALLAEAISAMGAGMLMDRKGLSAEDLSLIAAGIALSFFLLWSPLAFRF